MRILLALAILCAWAGGADAADRPAIGPAPAWVEPATLPATQDDAGDAALRVLLQDQQVKLEPGRRTTYSQTALRIQTPQGLAAGNISLPWRPETDVLTVHKLRARSAARSGILAFRPGRRLVQEGGTSAIGRRCRRCDRGQCQSKKRL